MGTPGTTSAVPAIHMDFYPTLLDLAGLPARPEQHVDGVSLVSVMDESGSIPDRALYWHYPHYGNQGGEPSGVILHKDWKLIRYYEDGREELYHVTRDIGEQNDLAAEQSKRVAALGNRLSKWLHETDARMPDINPHFDPVAYEREKKHIRDVEMPKLERLAAEFLESDFVGTDGTWWGSNPSGESD